jgi:hypothetical protein
VVLWAYPLAQTVEPIFINLYPQIAFDNSWKANVVVVNGGQEATAVRLFAYDTAGTLVQETSGGLPLDPGERRVYTEEDGAWPEGTSSLKVESDGPLLGFVVLESTKEKGLEAILPATAPNPVLTFPLIEKDPPWWNRLALMNVGAVDTELEIVALDSEGNLLAEALLPTLPPMASTAIVVSNLFQSSILASTAVVQVLADQPLAGVQLSGSETHTDLAALSALFGLGQELSLPIFQLSESISFWTKVGLFNPNEGPVNVTVEAFDAQRRSLGLLTSLTSLDSLSSHFFSTTNIGGALPADTASLAITADQPIGGYAVTAALDALGVTAVRALTENDLISDYELVGSTDGNVLAAVPLVFKEDGTSESLLADVLDLPVESFGSTAGETSSPASTQPDAIRAAEAPETLTPNFRGNTFTFTNDPLPAGAIVKAVHINELRQAISILRARNVLSSFDFTDSPLTPGVTILKIHITELRTALNQVFDALGRPRPSFTAIVAGQTAIKSVHITEIRTAVKDVDVFTLTLTFPGTGSGRVISNPAGIDCVTDCTGSFDAGTLVNLTGTPGAGSTFSGFGGDADCTDGQLTMNANKTCTAVFDPSIVFTAPNPIKPDATVGEFFEFSFCVPPAADTSGICSHPSTGANTPTGGQQPYTFLLESGTGFPPIGLILDVDGVLSGTPSVAGTTSFTVCAKDLAGFSDCKPTSLTVGTPLSVTASDTCGSGGEAPYIVSFNAGASEGKPPYTFLWDFDDGQTSTLSNPSHTYASPGSFTPSITVTDSEGRNVTLTRNSPCVVTAPPPPPSNGQCTGAFSDPNACGPCNTDADCGPNLCTTLTPAPFCS